jgi:hypothetical protein
MSGSVEHSIALVIDSAYAILDFPPGGRPNWAVGDTLYAHNAVLALRVFPDDESVSVLSWAEYKTAQLGQQLGDHGYSETPGERTVRVVGDIAVVQQQFTMDFRHRPAVSAVDVFGLVRQQGRWQIVSVLSDVRTSEQSAA